MSSISRRLFVQAGAMVTLAGVAVQRGWPANAAPYTKDGTVDGHLGARGCIALLPDTQFYSRYGVESADLFAKQYPGLPNPYDCQTQWIVDHTADYHIAMTHHLGDVCDQSGEGHEDQYVVADRAMKILDDAKVSYSVIPGNHDVADDFHYYRTWFPKDRQAHSPSFREMGPSGMSNWHEFTVAGVPMMAVNVPWGSDGADLDWAESVLNAHPTVPTIITTHQIIDISPDGTALSTSFGQRLWDRLINHHNQVFLTVNGHHHGATNRIVTNAAGQPVFQQLLDYQMAYQGGNGLMALMEFDFTHNQLCQTAFSPWVPLKGERANSLDRALLTGSGDTWVTSFDFASRFASFDADFHPTGEVPAATTALRAQLRKEFTPIAALPLVKPANNADYPKLPGTVAHWRPTEQDGTLVERDISGNGNDMTLKRAGILTNAAALVTDHMTYSSAEHAVHFTPRAKHVFAYFATAKDAPVNKERFEQGYTFETFIKIDKDYGSSNYWGAFVCRGGRRGDLPNFTVAGADTDDLEEPPLSGAISSLKEVQWAFTDTAKVGNGYSVWSGDVDLDKWYHLVVVDDPREGSVVMYIDGVPMLRNQYGTAGRAHGINGFDDRPWIIGGSIYDNIMDTGFFGTIGETRLVDHPTTPAQWLTARASSEPSPSGAPTSEPSPTASPSGSAGPSTGPSSTSPSTTKPSATGTPATPGGTGSSATPGASPTVAGPGTAGQATSGGGHGAPQAPGEGVWHRLRLPRTGR
ncbi:MAG: LamG-like jellyroll fold domain-containing protein [Cutibacterium granulosum]|uniref:LamG-like jellyroll fold domain-containing protein n=1 Tax=Cutibacterium granulosum TaxID=33011 RepID=UPI000AF36792|nr:LamG-like jellyroll fold domain-containing protein [Cutibacterium granulosum]MDU3821803.1 LamG-like jellyroll fold domain-containing protein [Cutibacterium granulosum]